MPFEIIKSGTHIDFLSRWRLCVAVSLGLVLIGIAAIPFRGFRLGIDFAGGTEVQVRFPDQPEVDEGDVRRVVDGLGIEGASVIRYGQGAASEFLIKFRGERTLESEVAAAAQAASEPGAAPEAAPAEGATSGSETAPAEPAAAAPGSPPATPQGTVNERTDRILALEHALQDRIGGLVIERVEFVGPKVGAELREDGLKAIGIACLLVLIYIAVRFSARFAPGAVLALVHDVLITSSVWILFGLEFDLRVLAGLLAILGYSLNDTIIVYDRIRENMELHTRYDLQEVLNRSVNQTLSRTLLTSGTTLVAVLALLFLGGDVIRPFALVMTIGILVGTYSSIYIAAPTLLWLEKRFGVADSGRKAGGNRARAARA